MFIHTVPEHEAHGVVADIYDRIRGTLAGAAGSPTSTSPPIEVPDVYRINSLVPSYLAYAGELLHTIISAGREQAIVPGTLPNFAVAAFSSCHFCSESIGAALRSQGVSAKLLDAIGRDLEAAELPAEQKVVLRWVRGYTQRSSALTSGDIDDLRSAGLPDSQIVALAATCGAQSWFTHHSDGGGAEFPALLHDRDWYAAGPPATAPAGDREATNGRTRTDQERLEDNTGGVAWVQTDIPSPELVAASAHAIDRYGFVPNVLRAASACPWQLATCVTGLELLDRSQSAVLSPAEHALVRAITVRHNRSRYWAPTVRALLIDNSIPSEVLDEATDPVDVAWDDRSRVLVQFTTKLVTASFKVVESDAERFRQAGLSDAGYVDVLGTVATQTMFDRTTNALGVDPDTAPLLRHHER